MKYLTDIITEGANVQFWVWGEKTDFEKKWGNTFCPRMEGMTCIMARKGRISYEFEWGLLIYLKDTKIRAGVGEIEM